MAFKLGVPKLNKAMDDMGPVTQSRGLTPSSAPAKATKWTGELPVIGKLPFAQQVRALVVLALFRMSPFRPSLAQRVCS